MVVDSYEQQIKKTYPNLPSPLSILNGLALLINKQLEPEKTGPRTITHPSLQQCIVQEQNPILYRNQPCWFPLALPGFPIQSEPVSQGSRLEFCEGNGNFLVSFGFAARIPLKSNPSKGIPFGYPSPIRFASVTFHLINPPSRFPFEMAGLGKLQAY